MSLASRPAERPAWGWREAALLAALFAFALALRSARLGDGLTGIPPGLHIDEAHNGLDALRIAEGARPLYLPGNDGREALYSYVQALFVAALGPSVRALRLASALLGALTVLLAYAWARLLPLPAPRWVAAATAFLTAATFWHVHFSRLAIRGVALPLVASLSFALLWRGLWAAPPPGPAEADRASPPRAIGSTAALLFAASGVALGLALHTHPAGRLLPLIPALFLPWLAWRERRAGRAAGARAALLALVLVGGAAAITALPLAFYAAGHPETFFGHAASVSVLDPAIHEGRPLARLATNAFRVARATVWRGSDSWYHNLRGRPVFGPATALLFLAGLAWLVFAALQPGRPGAGGDASVEDSHEEEPPRRGPSVSGGQAPATDREGARRAAVFCGLWILVMALPTVLTSGAPNFSRAVGVMPAIFLPPAAALVLGARAATARGLPRAASFGAAALVLALGAGLTARDVFLRYAEAPEPRVAFELPAVEKAALLRALAAEGDAPVFPSALLERRSVLRYLTADVGLRPLNLEAGLVLPEKGAVYAFTSDEEAAAAEAFGATWPWLASEELRGADGTPLWRLFRAAAQPPAAAATASGAARPVFGDSLAWWGVAEAGRPFPVEGGPETLRARPGETLDLVVAWRVLAPTDAEWTAFAHVVDAAGAGVGQDDGLLMDGRYPPEAWRRGDLLLSRHRPRIAQDAAHGTYALRLGFYDPDTGARLPLPGDDDAAAEVARIEIAP